MRDTVQMEEWAAKFAPSARWTPAQFGVKMDHPCGDWPRVHSYIDGRCEDCGADEDECD